MLTLHLFYESLSSKILLWLMALLFIALSIAPMPLFSRWTKWARLITGTGVRKKKIKQSDTKADECGAGLLPVP